jgi:hypothetical protein
MPETQVNTECIEWNLLIGSEFGGAQQQRRDVGHANGAWIRTRSEASTDPHTHNKGTSVWCQSGTRYTNQRAETKSMCKIRPAIWAERRRGLKKSTGWTSIKARISPLKVRITDTMSHLKGLTIPCLNLLICYEWAIPLWLNSLIWFEWTSCWNSWKISLGRYDLNFGTF